MSGLDLYSFADILIEHGVVNAINLDGGGSTTMAFNSTYVLHRQSGLVCVYYVWFSSSDQT